MRAIFVLSVVVLVLLLIGQIRVGGRGEYGAKGFFAWVRVGVFQIQVYPRTSKKSKKPYTQKQKQQVEYQQDQPQPSGMERMGGALDYARQLLPIALQVARQFHHRLQIDTLRLELQVGAADPVDAAMRYAQANAALGAIWCPLTQAFHVKDGQARISLDFEAGAMRLYGAASLSIKIGQLLWLGIFFGCRALITFLNIRKQHKLEQQRGKAA